MIVKAANYGGLTVRQSGQAYNVRAQRSDCVTAYSVTAQRSDCMTALHVYNSFNIQDNS